MDKVAQSLGQLPEAFLLAKRVSGCTEHTLEIYRLWLGRFLSEVGTPDPLAAHRFVAAWQERGLKPSSLHRGVRALRTFFRWCVATGSLSDDPLRGLVIRLPRTLPVVPTEDEMKAVLACCTNQAIYSKRNRVLILVMADSGLRASEVLRLVVEDWDVTQRSLLVRGGKGHKDRVTFVTPTTARALRDYLSTRRVMAARTSCLWTCTVGLSSVAI